MAIQIADQFSYSGVKPLDARFQYATMADMKTATESSLYDGCFAYVKATKKYYSYDSSNTVDTTTGRWREFSSGGGGGTTDYDDLIDKPMINDVTLSSNKSGASLKLYSTNDQTISSDDVADNDHFPIYDLSASIPKKIQYQHLRSKLRNYLLYDFDNGMVINCTCSAVASSQNKIVTVTVYSSDNTTVSTGTKIKVKFTYTNTHASPTISIRGYSATMLSAKEIKKVSDTGTLVTPTTWWTAGQYVDFIYDGTYWIMLTDLEGSGSISELNDIGDVNISSPTDGHVLVYDGTNSKWVNGGADNGNNYSTTEKAIGTWIDGKTLYQKVVNLNGFPGSTTKNVAHEISNISSVIDVEAWGYNSQADNWIVLPYYANGAITEVFVGRTNVTIYSTNSNMGLYSQAYAIIKYTKTT